MLTGYIERVLSNGLLVAAHILRVAIAELSVGSISQNLGFYTLFFLLVWIVSFQFSYKSNMRQPG